MAMTRHDVVNKITEAEQALQDACAILEQLPQGEYDGFSYKALQNAAEALYPVRVHLSRR